MKEPLISIVIPVKNGAATIKRCLDGIFRQTLADRIEVIIIDSGSEDDTLKIVKRYPVHLIRIPPEEFNHGATRNLGICIAKGEFVVMTVQDAEPADKLWLQKIMEGFVDDDVAGVCGQQIVPHDADKNPVQWFRPVSQPKIEEWEFESPLLFDQLSPAKKKEICGWDNVTACYRRSALLQVPFRKINFAEDAAWAMDALRAGYKIVYNKAARVHHYHHEDPEFAFRRTFTVLYHRYMLFGYCPRTPVLGLFNKLSWAKAISRAPVPLTDKFTWWVYNLRQFRNMKRAHREFRETVQQGDESLANRHKEICAQPPQGTGFSMAKLSVR